jgi:hypothetical protein
MQTPLRHRARALHFVLPVLSLVVLACTCTSLAPGELLRGVVPEGAKETVEQTLATLAQPTVTELTGQGEPSPTPAKPTSEVGGSPAGTAEPSGGEAEGPGLPALLAEGGIENPGIEANVDGETQGPILTLQLTNPESEEVLVEIPCGLIFAPETGDDEQRMMSIQPASAVVPGGGTAQIEPYVICIDADRAAPSLGTTYEMGEMASGDLLKLAECVCQEDLAASDEMDLGFGSVGVQFAVWAVSSDMNFEEMLAEEGGGEGALDDVLGEEGGELLGLMQDLLLAPAQEWLDRCGIEVQEKTE